MMEEMAIHASLGAYDGAFDFDTMNTIGVLGGRPELGIMMAAAGKTTTNPFGGPVAQNAPVVNNNNNDYHRQGNDAMAAARIVTGSNAQEEKEEDKGVISSLHRQGNELFTKNDIIGAQRIYSEAIDKIQSSDDDNISNYKKRYALHGNLSLCFLKNDDAAGALLQAEAALAPEAQAPADWRPKGMWRKIEALRGLKTASSTQDVLTALDELLREAPTHSDGLALRAKFRRDFSIFIFGDAGIDECDDFYAGELTKQGFRPTVAYSDDHFIDFLTGRADGNNNGTRVAIFVSACGGSEAIQTAASTFVENGGLMILCADIPDDYFKKISPSCSWERSDYSRLTPSKNQRADPPVPSGLPERICIKACWLKSVPEKEVWYRTETEQVMQSLVLRDRVEAGQVGAAFHRPPNSSGAMCFVGDVNWPDSGHRVVIAAAKWWCCDGGSSYNNPATTNQEDENVGAAGAAGGGAVGKE